MFFTQWLVGWSLRSLKKKYDPISLIFFPNPPWSILHHRSALSQLIRPLKRSGLLKGKEKGAELGWGAGVYYKPVKSSPIEEHDL